eukprot:gene32892-39776_t
MVPAAQWQTSVMLVLLLAFFSLGSSFHLHMYTDKPIRPYKESFHFPEVLYQAEHAKLQPVVSSHSAPMLLHDSTKGTESLSLDNVWAARTMLIVVSAFYGTNFGCVKILGSALHPSVAAAFRFTIASLVFMPQLLKHAKSNKEMVMGGFEVGIYSSIAYIAQATALLTSRASNVAFICSLAVIVVPIIESLFGEKKGPSYLKSALFPALLATAGVGCLELGGSTPPSLGDLWAFLQPVFFGLGFWRIERHMKLCTKPGEAQAFTGAMMCVVAAMSYIWTIFGFVLPVSQYGQEIFETSILSQITALVHDWRVPASLLWTGVVTTALTSYGENLAMKKLDAAESTVIYSTEPLWGTAFAALTLHEEVGWNTGVGALLVLAACVWSSLGPTIASYLSSSTLLYAEGFEEIWENVLANINKVFESFD